MLIDRRNKTGLACKFLLFIIIAFFFISPALSQTNEFALQEASQFDRAEIETIKMHTRQILSEPSFSPRKTFWQWLREKFSKWKGPKFNLGPGWAKFIFSFIVIWCVLALIAILIHFIWTICLLIRSNKHSTYVKGGLGHERVKIKSFEEMYKIALEMAKNEKFNEAISLMMTALLRWLNSMGVVRFHESKTNGDYIREYTHIHAGHNEFNKFVSLYEHTIYGGLRGSVKTYQQMSSLMELIRNYVTQKA
jgi:hypothetical protein